MRSCVLILSGKDWQGVKHNKIAYLRICIMAVERPQGSPLRSVTRAVRGFFGRQPEIDDGQLDQSETNGGHQRLERSPFRGSHKRPITVIHTADFIPSEEHPDFPNHPRLKPITTPTE